MGEYNIYLPQNLENHVELVVFADPHMDIQRIALTSGEPAGIGPDLCIQIAQLNHECEIIVLADPDLLAQRAAQMRQAVAIKYFKPSAPAQPSQAGTITVLPVTLPKTTVCGRLNPQNSHYVLELITQATEACLNGLFDALVTAPVHKGVINDAGIHFTGHTEFIADLTGGSPVMMLSTPGLRVALATTHLPLSKVSAAITTNSLIQVIEILNKELHHRFAIDNPNIMVCGLNPHAGENGYLGREEIDIIEPALNILRSRDINLQGPLPADSLFTPKYLNTADAVLTMYHDQGLPVLKHMGFGEAVNVTLGLPIIRTSVDHGTALNLAGTGQTSSGSLEFAIRTALDMLEGKKK